MMRKVQPFRADCTDASFEEWMTDVWYCSNFENQVLKRNDFGIPILQSITGHLFSTKPSGL